MELHQNCFKFNGGRNGLKHETELQSTQDVGYGSGLNMKLKPSNDSLFYFIGDNKVRPTNVDLNRSIGSWGGLFSLRIQNKITLNYHPRIVNAIELSIQKNLIWQRRSLRLI